MDPSHSQRPRVSRETRLLLTTALVAVAALWVLARIRFPDLPATPNPVSPLLSQLATTPTFDGLASEVSQLQTRLEPSLIGIDAHTLVPRADDHSTASRLTALRVRDDLAIALMPALAEAAGGTDRVVGSDPASGLIVVRVPSQPPGAAPTAWAPRRPDRPRFLMVTDASLERIALRPLYVASLEPIESVVWSDFIWMLPELSDVAPGSFLFTTTGEFAGMVIEDTGRRAVVPSVIILAELERLVAKSIAPAGDLGIHVQPLTPDVAAATGARVGVVVNWVDEAGPATAVVAVGDVIEAVDGRTIPTPEHWRVRVARLGAGDALALRVRRRGEVQDVRLRAPTRASPAARNASLGLRLRAASGGAEVLGVEPGSAARRAGLAAGDVITSIGDIPSPTPLLVRTTFSESPEGKPVLISVTRGATHLVTTLPR